MEGLDLSRSRRVAAEASRQRWGASDEGLVVGGNSGGNGAVTGATLRSRGDLTYLGECPRRPRAPTLMSSREREGPP